MPTVPVTIEEFLNSLNGFDEIAVEQHFGGDIPTLAQQRPTKLVRALAFVHYRREGSADHAAKEKALALTLGDLDGFFAEADDIAPEDPDSEPGKAS